MRIVQLLLLILVPTLASPFPQDSHPWHLRRQALDGIFNPSIQPNAPENEHHAAAPNALSPPHAEEEPPAPTLVQHTTIETSVGLLEHLTSPTKPATSTQTSTPLKASLSTQAPSTTISDLHPTSTSAQPSHPSFLPSATTSSDPPAPSSSSESSNQSASSKEWKIIGVAVVIFSSIAAVLLLSVFFDQWWKFIKDIGSNWRFSRKYNRDLKKRKLGDGFEEELVPDWEKASWEIRVGLQKLDDCRYPSFTNKNGGDPFNDNNDGVGKTNKSPVMTGIGTTQSQPSRGLPRIQQHEQQTQQHLRLPRYLPVQLIPPALLREHTIRRDTSRQLSTTQPARLPEPVHQHELRSPSTANTKPHFPPKSPTFMSVYGGIE
ncbi:hypothetical protein ABKN59_003466 [Abortiporus biennis]